MIIMKIYDCFIFFNELDLLEIRLNELNGFVDYFVIVESDKTFTGNYKGYIFEKNKSKYKSILHKIIYIKVTMPSKINPWQAEFLQRNKIKEGLKNCNENDIILISDIDEIPNLKKIKINKLQLKKNYFNIISKLYRLNIILTPVERIIQKINNYKFSIIKLYNKLVYTVFIKKNTIYSCQQNLYFYYLNGIYSEKWIGTVITPYYNFKYIFNSNTQIIRDVKDNGKWILNAGWHFSYLGNVNAIKKKLDSYAHTEYNTPEYNQTEILMRKIENGIHIIHNKKIKYVEINKTFPNYVILNKKKLIKKGLIK